MSERKTGEAAATDQGRKLFAAAGSPPGSYNEAFFPSGEERPHWRELLEALEQKGAEALDRDRRRVVQMRHEDGATINPFDDPERRSTSWDLDPVPLLVAAAEWPLLEAGVSQRARLLEEILGDVYGEQQLLKSGRMPAEMVFANPRFLYACHGVRPPGERYLTFYAVDLSRGTDGRFRVLRDHCANPSGLGYALENRIVMSRVFSGQYHRSKTLRLAPFFKSFHQALITRASLGEEDPGIVLLSPGPESRTYFEHALLSRYLGYPLVEAQDLTVRNGRVFLKKLAGLEAVEAVFRHLPDLNCDPFVMRNSGVGGVAGLIQVCREGNVAMVNPVGSGFGETPELASLLPALCPEMLGDELLLENQPLRGGGAPAGERHIAAKQDPLQPAVAPGWGGRGCSHRQVLLRLFACATEEGFTVMPGGLAITADDGQTLLGDDPERQQSKDVWVFSEAAVEPFSLMRGFHRVREFKRGGDLPSRVADHLLWLGRYLERSEGLVRLLRLVFRRISGEDRAREIPEMAFLLTLLRAKNSIPPAAEGAAAVPLFDELSDHLAAALWSREKADSVVALLGHVQRTARNVRDRLSLDSFRIINRLEDLTARPSGDPLEFLEEILFTLSGFSGLAMESMTRSFGWRFMDMGRRIERAVHQTGLLHGALPLLSAEPRNILETLLEISDSTMTYRARYRSAFQLAPVLDLLLADESNPKSLAFQLDRIAAHLDQLPRQSENRFAYAEERLAQKMLTGVRLLELRDLSESIVGSGAGADLLPFLAAVLKDLKELSQHITGHYLTRVPTTPHFASLAEEGGK